MLDVAIIGCGAMGALHLARWAEVSGARIAAVCDSDAARAARAAAEFGAEPHSSVRGMLDGARFDVVDICTPPDSQSDATLMALAAGANVLCQIPMGLNPGSVRRLAEAANAAGRLLMPAFTTRFHPLVLLTQEMIDSDDLGRVVMMRVRLSAYSPDAASQGQADAHISGSGALSDAGMHAVDLFRFLAGEVQSAAGFTATFNPSLVVEDSAAISLKSVDGALGSVECSWSTPNGRSAVEVYGTAGTALIDLDNGSMQYRTADMPVWEVREAQGPDRFQREIGHFADCVRGSQKPAITPIDAVRALEIVTLLG